MLEELGTLRPPKGIHYSEIKMSVDFETPLFQNMTSSTLKQSQNIKYNKLTRRHEN